MLSGDLLKGLGLGQCFAVTCPGFGIAWACKEEFLACRTYLDGGDYVGAAAEAAGKLHLGYAGFSRLS